MIIAAIFCDSDGLVIGFKVQNHGDPIVCAGVSSLVINTVNSIEALTKLTSAHYIVKCDAQAGSIGLKLKKSVYRASGAGLLLDALALGLANSSAQYPSEIKLSRIYRK